MKKKVKYEIWESSENRSEIHYFLEGTDTYVLGFNPKIIQSADVIKLLNKFDILGPRKLRKKDVESKKRTTI